MDIKTAVKSALWEDLKDIGDITVDTLIPEDHQSNARIFAKQNGVLAGSEYIVETFSQIGNVNVELVKQDGDKLSIGDTIAKISGSTRMILTGERTALNFAGHLSGIATTTNNAVKIAKPYNVVVACTRKTTPMLRDAEKLAVKSGGGDTHRFGLYDAVMIKDNHLLAEPDIVKATKIVQEKLPNTLIEVEVDTLEQLKDVLSVKPNVILLDNMNPETLKKAVEINNGLVRLEASGNITPQTMEEYCKTGVDVISMGWLTHSANNLDLSLELLLDK